MTWISMLRVLNHHLAAKLVVIAIALFLLPGCVNRMFYHPNRIEYRTAEQMPGPTRDVCFTSADGTPLHGWFVASPVSNALGTVVHFHGNAQNLTAHSGFVDWLPAEGFHLFLFDYRGYGRSAGRPSRRGLVEDGIAALQEVRRQPEVDTNRIVIIGQSLGGTVALAAVGVQPDLRPQAMIIDSTFYSYRRIVRDKIALIPLLSWFRWPLSHALIGDRYSPADFIADLSPTPVLFLHGTADFVIPHHHSEWLYERAGEPKELIIIQGGEHCSGMVQQRAEIAPRIRDFMIEALNREMP
ncbi:MAG TPA: alpha/beta hydrolase [Kiritimatiellia bacterium]|nr:alpha/beta hydrolase [Kiritimatiellia bacterium]HMO97886.1 alpha/beta hydrolase [Kiritimatiellia bacterium]